MEAIRTIQKSNNGLLHLSIPQHFQNIDLEIIILPLLNSPKSAPSKNRLQMIAHLKGSLPNLSYSKYDFYEQ